MPPVLQEVKTYFACNGGAFFWVSKCTTPACGGPGDTCGVWSDPVWEEVKLTSGCLNGAVTTSTQGTSIVDGTVSLSHIINQLSKL